jgi:cytochrome c-type biogenesis protein CcmF
MHTGFLFILLALFSTLFSGFNYFSALGGKSKSGKKTKKTADRTADKIKMARFGFYIMTGLVVIASAYLLYLFLSHQFQVSYVYRYSSRDLPLGFLISSFWAGQEGSFLFWALLIAMMGVVMIRTAGEVLEAHAMLVVNIVQAFFLLILLKASPFELLPQVPVDGAGLNPLLQNLWMVIHPPILFIGYAAITFPFAISFAALTRREYKLFAAKALPWTLFSSLTLGAGIIIGGYWAYQVLGWGGYWGWDPVENSSLIPWLTTLALVHGLIVQKRKGALQKTNHFLAVISFVLVLYATFLTRSGILADFSVHSFQDLGINLYLIIFIIAALGIGFSMFFRRYREIPRETIDYAAPNRENAILASLFVFLASAFLVFVGTSSPIITGFFGNPSAATISYYNRVHLPIAILMGLLLGIAPLLRWREEGMKALLKNLVLPFILTIISTAVPIFFGMRNPVFIIFVATAALAFWSNLFTAIRFLRINWLHTAAPLTHVGVALMLTGIIISGTFEQNQKVVLEKGVPLEVMDYQMVYNGMISAPNGKDVANIEVSKEQTTYNAHPRFYYSQYNRGMMREPDVRSGLMYDLYISPMERRNDPGHTHNTHSLIIKKGDKKQFGEYEIFFKRFDMAQHSESGVMRVGADLDITRGENTYSVVPALLYTPEGQRPEVATFPAEANTNAEVKINQIDADQKIIELVFEGIAEEPPATAAPADQLLVDVSKKPFMNLLWLGTILIIVGTMISIKRRLTPAAPG